MTTTLAQVLAIPGLVLAFDPSTNSPTDGQSAATLVNLADGTRSGTKHGTPVFKTGICNGKTVVRMVAANTDYFNIANGGLALTDFTIIEVCKAAGDTYQWGNSTLNPQIRKVGSTLTAFNPTGGFHPTSTTLAAPTAWSIWEYSVKDEHCKMYENGVARGPSNNVAVSPLHSQWSPTGIILDQYGATFGSAQFTGDRRWSFVWNRRLTHDERAKVYDFLDGDCYTGNDATGLATHPAILPSPLSFPRKAVKRLYSTFNFEAAAAVDASRTPIDVGHVWNFNTADVANTTSFRAAIASRIPDPGAAGVASFDVEISSPCIPPDLQTYTAAQWVSTDREGYAGDRAYIIGLLGIFISLRPGVEPGVYWEPYIAVANFAKDAGTSLHTEWAYAAVNADYEACYWYGATPASGYAGGASLMGMVVAAKQMQPELYVSKNMNLDQATMNAWFNATIGLCHGLQKYAGDGVGRDVLPFLWLQQVPGGVGVTIPDTSGGTFTLSTRVVHAPGAFANLALTGDPLYDRLNVESASGGTVTPGHAVIQTRVDADNVVLAASQTVFTANATSVRVNSRGVFLPKAMNIMQFTALQQSPADGAYVGGDAHPTFYSTAEWQQMIDTNLGPALTLTGPWAGGQAGLGRSDRVKRVQRTAR